VFDDDPRRALDALIRERREDYAGLSRLLGRNPAYIQQFIKRGVPRKLDEADRRTLAAYFRVPESRLGGPASPSPANLIAVDRLDVRASAGGGVGGMEDRALARIAFSAPWLRELAGGRTDGLSLIEVRGDSMEPVLRDGDEILVDRVRPGEHPRDGIVVLRHGEDVLVKRLSIDPVARRYTIRSDNERYAPWRCGPHEVEIIGRVIWAGRRVA
jgi:phage repressor protein C with HTH and peptisase S24 domain